MASRGSLNTGEFAVGFGKSFLGNQERERERADYQDRLSLAERMAGARLAEEDKKASDQRTFQAGEGRANRMAADIRNTDANAARVDAARIQAEGKKEPYTADPFIKFREASRGKDGALPANFMDQAEALGYLPKGMTADSEGWKRAKAMAGPAPEAPPAPGVIGDIPGTVGRVATGAAFGKGYITTGQQRQQATANLQKAHADHAALYKQARDRGLNPQEALDFVKTSTK